MQPLSFSVRLTKNIASMLLPFCVLSIDDNFGKRSDLICITTNPNPRKEAALKLSPISLTVIESISIAITITLAIFGGRCSFQFG